MDGLLAEKLQLEQQVEDLTKEQVQLREQVRLVDTNVRVCDVTVSLGMNH